MIEETYNGWSNYPTWLCKLWLDNEQGRWDFWMDRAKEIYESNPRISFNSTATKKDRTISALGFEIGETIAEEIDELFRDNYNGMLRDFLNAAVSEINLREIAESILDDIEQLFFDEIDQEDKNESENE